MSSRQSSETLYNFQFQQSPPVQPVQHALLQQREVQLSVLRLDKLDPQLGGNKWYKLQAYLYLSLIHI